MIINMGGKFTDIKQGLIRMLESYKTVRKLIQKLTNKSLTHLNEVDPLIKQIRQLHKIKEREIKHYAELQLGTDVEKMLKSFINKNDSKIRRLDVYSHVSCYLNVLSSKISHFVPKNLEICTLTPELMKWKLFLSQINENKDFVLFWMKSSCQRNPLNIKTPDKLNSVYKFSTTFTKANTPTTHYSFNESVRGQIVEAESKVQFKKYSYLKRCQTAKPKATSPPKKQYPLHVRSPSAKEYIKQNIQNESKVRRNITLKKTTKRRINYRPESGNQFNGSIEIIKLKQNHGQVTRSPIKVNQQKEVIISVRQRKSLIETTGKERIPDQTYEKYYQQQKEEQTLQQIAKNNLFPINLRKNSEIGAKRRSSVRKIRHFAQTQFYTKTDHFNGNQNAIPEAKSVPQISDEQDSQNLASQKGDKCKASTKRGRQFVSDQNSQDADSQDNQFQQEQNQKDNKDKDLRRHSFKQQLATRKNGQRMSLQAQNIRLEKASKKSQRRVGMISSKEFVSVMRRIQTKQREEEKEKELELKKKAIEFNSNLVDEMENEEEEITQVEYEKQLTYFPVTSSKAHDLYKELTRLKKDQMKAAKETPMGSESSFFMKQDFLRQQKSRELQNYLKKMRTKHTSMGEIFELRTQQTNNKVENYMVIERRFAFEADNEWIKQNYGSNKFRDSQNDPELVQQESRQSWTVNELQEF